MQTTVTNRVAKMVSVVEQHASTLPAPQSQTPSASKEPRGEREKETIKSENGSSTTTSTTTTTTTNGVKVSADKYGLASKLYYHILETMLLAEEARLHNSNFTSLLMNEVFHKSLLAVCFEITFFVFKITPLAFPFVLNAFEVKAFDLFKMVSHVLRYARNLPQVVVSHLSFVEERILEQYVWQSDSPIFTLMQNPANQHLVNHTLSALSRQATVVASPSVPFSNPLNTNVVLPLNSPQHNRTANGVVSTLGSPLRITGGTHSTSTSTTISGAGSNPTGGAGSIAVSLDLFYKKLATLAFTRVQELCLNLKLHMPAMHSTWHTVRYIIVEQPTLLFNRHLDHMIMSAIYGVCRIQKIELTFKQIIEAYKFLPHAQYNSKIYREVFIGDIAGEAPTQNRADIITFYNKKFIPILENFLYQMQENRVPLAPVIASPKRMLQHGFLLSSSPRIGDRSPSQSTSGAPFSPTFSLTLGARSPSRVSTFVKYV